jgi:hypothetical protein
LSISLQFTASYYHLVSHCIVYLFNLQLLITTWYLIVLSISLQFTASYYHLVSHCIVYLSSIYSFRLPLGISLYCPSLFNLQLQITTWYLIVLSISLQFTASNYHLVSHCIVYLSSIYSFWLPLGIFQLFIFTITFQFSNVCVTFYFRTENTDDSNEEENLIQLTLNGTDDILTGQEISNFISSCQNLNCEKVVDLLNSQLKQPVVFVNIYYFINFVEMFSVIMTKT